MTDTEDRVRRGFAQLVRDKPDLGPIDLKAIAGRQPTRPTHRWLLAAAAFVVVAGLGAATWFGLLQARQTIPAGPEQQPNPLNGVRWLATQIDDTPAVPDMDGRVPSLTFEPDGQLWGSDPCNTMDGTYQLDGDRLKLSASATTEMACGAVFGQQTAYPKALARTATFRRDASTLTLLDSRGKTLVRFKVADQVSPEPTTKVLIRIRNDASMDFADVHANYRDERGDYGSLVAGETSTYRAREQAYSYSYVRVLLPDGRTLILQPKDFVGKLLPPGRYTYVLTLDGKDLDQRLEVDQ